MKTIGMIGGLGPEATQEYYRIITTTFRERRGGDDLPYIVIYSMNVHEAIRMAEAGQWDDLAKWLSGGVEILARAGADFGLISANTPHIVFDDVRAASPIPLLSIVEETCRAAAAKGLSRVGLLGTKFTMQATFYRDVLAREGIETVVPASREQEYIHEKLIDEIGRGRIVEATRTELLSIIRRMKGDSAIDGVILGCTELPLILTEDAFGIPFLDTTRIHAEGAVRYSLSD